ncbi:E3 ubiquitin-protein ligase rfwd3-like [Plakobranchus ocellatus]|uniref:RING-type E3 ubiquitin transferase n=1 Tax=Plakobranchus ocellatus TaxID=259542 RepID=A0AAV4BN00_9GAST|nr:E3 ubiquitin-protein ligase rfwd3-like [Plakobranchus ocellatus]
MEDHDSDNSRASVLSISSDASDELIPQEPQIVIVDEADQNPASESDPVTHQARDVLPSHSQPSSLGEGSQGSGSQRETRENLPETDGTAHAVDNNDASARVQATVSRASPAVQSQGGETVGAEVGEPSSQGDTPPGSQNTPSPDPGKAYKEFFALVDDLRQKHQTREAQTTSDPAVSQTLTSLHKSLLSIIRRNGQEPPDSSPPHKKRKQSQDGYSPNAKKVKVEVEEAAHDDEDCCPICLEPWSTGGEHRITSLQCGHLFGSSCITKWVDQAKSCPQCKAKAKKSDFRGLFVKKISAEDTSQRDRAMLLLELEKDKCRQLERCEATLRMKLETQAQDLELMRRECSHMKAELTSRVAEANLSASASSQDPQPSTSNSTGSTTSNITGKSSSTSSQVSSLKRFHTFQRIYISQEGQCRVFDFSKDLGMTVISQKSSNPLFRGYGIKMLARDFRPLSYQPLHSMQIRDMSFRPGTLDGMLLTCSLDKTVLLSSVNSKAVIQKYSLDSAVWCCAWNTHDTNLFYVGMGQGVVREFDIRRTNAHVRDVLENGGSPISNVQFWRGSDSQGNFFQGLLIAQLQNLVFKQQVRNNFTNYVLPQMKAPVMSLCLHSSGKFLASFRPGLNNPKCKYEVSDIRMTDEDQHKIVTSRLHAMFDGGNVQAVITRNCLMSRPESEEELLAVTADHANNTVNVWDFDRRSNFQTLPCYEKAIDIKPVVPCNTAGNYLGVLTDKDLVLYKWRE